MKKNNMNVSRATLALLLLGTTLLTRKGVAHGWVATTGEEPPNEEDNSEVRLKDAALWALASGAAVGLARMAVRRTIGYRGVPAPRQ